MNHNINILYAGYLVCDPQRGQDPQVERFSLFGNVKGSERKGIPLDQQPQLQGGESIAFLFLLN